MTLSDISIKKPVFAWMLMIGLIVFGAISFYRMGISQLPDVDFPVLTVSVTWVGASPETMEAAVTDVIEDAVMSVEGIKSVSSTCQEGISNTTIEFELTTNIDVALEEVQTKIAQAQRALPVDINPPVVTKSNPEDQPIIWAGLTGPNSLRDKVLFVRDHLKDTITTVSGVGDARLGGYVDPNMRIWLNVNEMARQEIAVSDVIAAVGAGTVLTPSGFMDNGDKESNVRIMSEATNAESFANLIIPTRSGSPVWKSIKIGDIGRVNEGLADIRRISRLNGQSSVALGIIKQRGSNAVAVGDAVKEKIKSLGELLPQGMKLQTMIDGTRFIRAATHELVFTLSIAVVLTSLVCYLFLGSVGSAFNVILAIPTSLIGSFTVLYFLGFTINTFTLLALSLSIGIVVDDAIMVLENIVRHAENGMSRVRAALFGAREITGAAVAASLAILAIFLPVVFMKGIVGKFFFQFGIGMSVAVVLSLIEALTLAPMRCSQFLSTGNPTRLARWVDKKMEGMCHGYQRLLGVALRYRWSVIIGATAVFVGSLFLVKGIRQEMLPPQDQSQFIVTMYTPMGSSIDFTDRVFKQAEEILAKRGEVLTCFTNVGGFQGGVVNQGSISVVLKNPDERPIQAPFTHRASQQELMAWARDAFSKIPGVVRATGMDPSLQGFTAKRGYPVTLSVQGPDWEKLATNAQMLMEKMRGSGLMTDIDTDYNPNMPELQVIPERLKSEKRGVTNGNIASTISAAVGSLQIGKYTDSEGRRDDIRIKLLDEFNRVPKDITKIPIRNIQGQMLQLGEVVKFTQTPSLLTISRYNRERAITVFANIAPGKSQADAIKYVQNTAKDLLPAGYHVVLSGGSQAFQESFDSLMIALVLGIFVAYMVLGSQFNSFIHPFTVLLALPFSVSGALIALRVTGISLNIYSMIGMLLLMGIVKKNSILLVDFTNKKRISGLAVREALLTACPLRLRPILMTSIACVTAVIPAALAMGPGSETTRPMSVVVIGGVILSTLLTLVVVPCAYSLLSRLEGKKLKAELEAALREEGMLPDLPAQAALSVTLRTEG